jgi:amino acid transporter
VVSIIIGTIINIAGVRLLAFINNIGVAAEIIGMFVFALILLIFFKPPAAQLPFQRAFAQ